MTQHLASEFLEHLDPSPDATLSIQSTVKATMHLPEWRGCLTAFSSFYDVFPKSAIASGSWVEIKEYLAGSVAIGSDKDLLPFVVPCLLKEAPFTPKSLPKALASGMGSVGKQRSSAHMTAANWLVMDIDGMDKSSFDTKVHALKSTGCAFCVYSTHSHGRADKPGVRARLVLPIDRQLEAAEYELAWLGMDMLIFSGDVSKADASGRHLWQQQGVWATAEERKDIAFTESQDGSVWSANALVAKGPVKQARNVAPHQPIELSPTDQVERLAAALPWIDAEDTATWIKAVTAFKASSEIIGETNALELAMQYSANGSDEARKLNHSDSRYNPEVFFNNVMPAMPPDAGIGVILGLAKAGALRVMECDRGEISWSEPGRKAAGYLSRYHYQTFVEHARKKEAYGLPPIDSIVSDTVAQELREALQRINKEHFVSLEGGKTSVFKEAYDHEIRVPRLDKMSFESFRQLWSTDRVRVVTGFKKDGTPSLSKLPVAPIWLNSPFRRTYINGMALLADAAKVPHGIYNLWRGWGCVPKMDVTDDEIEPALTHLLKVVCADNKEHYTYMLNWMASVVQNPDLQAEVAVILLGGRGTGKGTLGRWMRDIFGAHGIHITHPRHLTGNFNGHLRLTAFAFVDEAFFAGDKAGNSVLKALITEDQVSIEKKGIDTIQIRNRLKILMATNDAHAILAGEDERRYFVLEVSDCHKQDKPYFKKLNNWWGGGGKEALLGFLLQHDLGDFEIRDVPNTKALEEQKTESLDPVDKWLLNVIAEGDWSITKWKKEVPRPEVVGSLEQYVKANNLKYVNTGPTSVGKRLRKHMAVGGGQETTGNRGKTWLFPDLDDARKQFSASLGLKHFDWDAI